MNDHEWGVVEGYVRTIANVVELRDWTITVSREPAPKGCSGHVEITYGRKLATISLDSSFRGRSREDQRQTVVHELVHLHLESAANMVQNDLEQWLGKQADQIFYDGFKRQMEYGVDALADALAKHLPLVEWD